MAVVVGLVVIFFAATRTQVGRDGLARQMESRFSQTTGAQLSIGRLTGNVLNDLYASDVRIWSPEGRLLAEVDSVMIRPRWRSLLQRDFSVHRILLDHPTIHLTSDSTGRSIWSGLGRADLPDSVRSEVPAAWHFRGAALKITDAAIIVDDGVFPSGSNPAGVRFDGIREVDLDAVIDWSEELGQIDLLAFSAFLPESGIRVEEAVSQIAVRNGKWTLNQAIVRTRDSEFRMRGSMDALETITRPQLPLNHAFQLELEPSTVDMAEWKRLIPALPFGGRPRVSFHIGGPLSALTLAWFRLDQGASSFEASGTAVGYPDSVRVEVSVSDSRFTASDLQTLLPENRRIRDLRTDVTDAQLYVNGLIKGFDLASLDIDSRSTFSLLSTAGNLSGTATFQGQPADTLQHALTVRVEDLNGYPWTSRIRWQTDVNGILTANGRTVNMSSVESRLTGQLSNLAWGQRKADSLSLDIQVLPDSLTGQIDLFAGGGAARNQISLVMDEAGPARFRSRSSLESANVGPLLGRTDVVSSINAQVTVSSFLSWNRSFAADLTADVAPSTLIIGTDSSAVPAHHVQAVLRPPDEGRPVLDVRSDMFDVTVDSDISVPTIVSLARAWEATFRSARDAENRKLRNSTVEESLDPTFALNELLATDAARDRFPEDLRQAHTSILLTLHSGALVSALSPALPALDGSGSVQADVEWSADSLQTWLTAMGPGRLVMNQLILDEASLDMNASVVRGASLLGSLDLDLSAKAETLRAGSATLIAPDLDIDVRNGAGTIAHSSRGSGRIDSTRIEAFWQHGADYNMMRVDEVLLGTGANRWLLTRPATFRIYGDATALDGFNFRYFEEGQQTEQEVFAGGVLSASDSDSMLVSMNKLLLRPLSGFMQWRRTLGGQVDADILIRGGLTQPRLAGSLDVTHLSLDHYLLGNVSASSDYLASRPEVAVELRLDPLPPDEEATLFGTDFPASVIQNDLSVRGDVRFPGRLSEPDGVLNLDVNIDRADVFWMKYILQEALGDVSGYLSGSGRVTGTFAYPVFDVDLGLLDGRFDIPYTKAEYTATGNLRLDREAIHFTPLRLEDTTGGRAEISGRLLFNDYTSFSFDMNGALDELQIMNVAQSERLPFYGFIWASGDVRLTGPLFDARLVSTNGRTRADSELFIPIEEETSETDQAFIVFEDSLGVIPDFDRLESRSSILQRRPTSERQFLDGLNLDLNIDAPSGSTVHLVIDPLLGDVINAVSEGEVQLVLENDEFQVFGRLDVTSGDYQFTAGELFIKTFLINPGGSITWSGDPVNATLDIPASYKTRASRAGLPGAEGERPGVIPLIVDLQIDGTVESPEVDLSLSIDRSNQNVLGEYQALEALLNQPDRATEYATSVLILNSFQLTTENITTDSGSQLAFNSVSQLVTAQLNRFLASALPNVDFSFGLQGESAQDLDVTYGVALRLLNERLIIRGEGVYQGARSTDDVRTTDGLQGEFVVEIRVGPRVSVEVFFRRESDILETTQLTNTAGVGLSYQTEFESWRSVFRGSARQPSESR